MNELRKRIRQAQRVPDAPSNRPKIIRHQSSGVAQSSEQAEPGVELYDISSEPDTSSPEKSKMHVSTPITGDLEVASSGLLYVQKIVELEALNIGLERDLELLQSSEQCLLDDSREKQDLVAYLMRQFRSRNPDSEATMRSQSSGMLGNLWWRQSPESEADLDELERVAEEATRDNIRLRNHLRGLGEELLRIQKSAVTS